MNKTKLKKELSFLDIFCIASGAMISSGLFILPGIAHEKVGPALFISYFLAGLLTLAGVFSQSELVSAMPKAGGAYFFVTRSLGPAVGMIQGLLTWLSLVLKSSFALVGMVAFIKVIFPQLDSIGFIQQTLIGVVLAAGFTFLNIIGVKKAGKFQVYLVLALFAALFIYIGFGIPAINMDNLVPFTPHGIQVIFIATGYIFVSYGGLLTIASLAEEVPRADKIIPLAMISSLVAVTIIYSVVILITSGVLGADKLNGSLTPISDGAFVFMGQGGSILLGIAAVMSFITTANAGIMSASRYPLALSRDKLIPPMMGKVHEKHGTPYVAVLLSGGLVIASLFLKLDVLVELASTVLILSFILSHLSVLILRESRIQNYRPTFKSICYPWMQIVGILLLMVILFEMSREVFFVKMVFIVCGFFIYWFYGRLRNQQKFALLHIVERLTAKELNDGKLEKELKDILLERDSIVRDRFDHLVDDCLIMDLKERVTVSELFDQVAKEIALDIGYSVETIKQLLVDREKERSTVISDKVAVPHIIIEGRRIFDLVVVRCRDGIAFDDEHSDVKAVFFLIGTQDERNFHLRAISAVAQIVSDISFDHYWMKAKYIENIRDLLHLSKRKRG